MFAHGANMLRDQGHSLYLDRGLFTQLPPADFAPAYLGHVWVPPIATREMEQVEVAKVTLPGTPTKSEVEKVTQPGHVWPVATPTETDREKVSVKSSRCGAKPELQL